MVFLKLNSMTRRYSDVQILNTISIYFYLPDFFFPYLINVIQRNYNW